jgi:hypothetical protein
MDKLQTEVAWPGGPLRVKGSGTGKATRYVCGSCWKPCNGIYRLLASSNPAEMWVCSRCRRTDRVFSRGTDGRFHIRPQDCKFEGKQMR